MHSLSFSQVKQYGVPYIQNYEIDDYSFSDKRLSPQNWKVFQDSSGIMYFGNSDGLLSFDGRSWRFLPLPNNSVLRSIATGPDGRIYVGGESEFGYLSIDSSGGHQYRSLSHLVPDSLDEVRNIWGIDNVNDTILFRGRNKIFFYYQDSIVHCIQSDIQFFHHFKYNGELYIFEAGRGLAKLVGGKLELIPDGDYYENYTAWAVFPFGDDSLLFTSPIDGFSIYSDKEFEHWDIPASLFLKDNRVSCGVQLEDGNFAFGTQSNGIVIVNQEGEIIKIFNEENGLQNNAVHDIMLDQNGGLWVALSYGISYLKLNSPFSYYTQETGIPKQNYYVREYKGNLFFSSDKGVHLKSGDDLDNEFEVTHAEIVEGAEGQSWLFCEAGDFLLCGHNPGVLVFKIDELHKTLDIPSNVWEIVPDEEDGDIFYASSIDGIYVLKLEEDDIHVDRKIKGFSGNALYFAFDETGKLWVSDAVNCVKRLTLNHARDSVIKIDTFSSKDGLPADEDNWIVKKNEEIVFLSSSHYGFYRYSEEKDKFVSYNSLNKRFGVNGEISLFVTDSFGNVWVRDDGMVRIFKEEKEDDYEEKEVSFEKFKGRNLERLSFIDNNIAVFGTDEYVLLYYPEYDSIERRKSNSFIRKIKSIQNDSVIFKGYRRYSGRTPSIGIDKTDKLILPYEMNALRFEYSSAFYENPEDTRFFVWLEGYEQKPNKWISEGTKEYTNLREGDYTFHVIAKDIHGDLSNECTYSFAIEAPWYRTIYAYIVYFFITLALLYLFVRLYVKKIKADRDRLERIIKQRTGEIQQQKEEITAQAEELEKINKELQKLSLVASKTDNAVLIADSKGNIEWINEGFTHLFGYTLEEFKRRIGRNIVELGVENIWKNVLEEVKQNKQSAIFESEIITKDNNTLNIQTTLTPILNKNEYIDKYIAISTNISQLKETQKELHKLIATKDKFFSIIAHDLKNPFHSLMGISELLIKNVGKHDQGELIEIYEHLYQLTHQGYQLLTNLLEWARSQTGRLKFNPERVHLYNLVEDSLELICSTAKSKGVKILNQVDDSLYVNADKNTVITVLRNLVSNAVKYSKSNTYVKIFSKEINQYVKVYVEDEGVGISQEDKGKLFRMDESYSTKGTEGESGTGLGLILCKEFVEKNGGEIFVSSEIGAGSTFSFTLKLA